MQFKNIYKNLKQKRIFFSFLFLILILGIILIIGGKALRKGNQDLEKQFSNLLEFKSNSSPSLTPTPDLFADLTIPYLRSRTYKGSLISSTKLSENESYTSYIASFASDGLRINGLLTQPKGDKPVRGWPAIVFIHGYIPPRQYQTTQNYGAYVDYLAKSGFVVFKIDLRGNGDSEGDAAGGYYSGDYITDTLNARAALTSSDFVNPKRIGLWGHSMAGNVVFRSLVAAQNIPAVVIWAGAGYTYTDLREFRISDLSYRPPLTNSPQLSKGQKLRELHGDFNTDDPFWKQVAPTNYLEGVAGVIEIHHAADDAVVSIEYSRNLMKILDTTPIAHKLHEYPSGGHNITGASFNLAMQRTVEFFKKNLDD